MALLLIGGSSATPFRRYGGWVFYDASVNLRSSNKNYVWGSDEGLLVTAGVYSNTVSHKLGSGRGYASNKTTPISSIQPRHVMGLSNTLIWVAHQTGVIKYNSTTDAYDVVHTWSTTARARLFVVAENNIWACTDTEVWHYNGTSWSDRTSEIPNSPTSFYDIKVRSGVVYVLSHDATPTTQIHRYDGSWTTPHNGFGTNVLHIVMSVWGDDDILVARHYTGNWKVYALQWNGTDWTGDAGGLLYSRDTYQWGTPYVEDIYSDEPGHYIVVCRNPDYYGPDGHLFEYRRGQWKDIAIHTNAEFYSVTDIGWDLAADFREDVEDSTGRPLLADNEVRDVMVIDPQSDPSFGEASRANFWGMGYDGHRRINGVKTIPGADISFGTVAGGLNDLAWYNYADDEGHGASPDTRWNDPNIDYDVSIPSEGELRMYMKKNAGAGAAGIVTLNAQNRWLLPPNTDFEFTFDFDVTFSNIAVMRFYLQFQVIFAANKMRNTNPYVPPRGNDWNRPDGGSTYFETDPMWYDSLAAMRLEARRTENNSNKWVNTLGTGPKISSGKVKFSRVGDTITQALWDPNASGGAGAWIGNNTCTLGNLFSNNPTYGEWLRRVAMGIVTIQLYDATPASQLASADVRITNFQLTGATPTAFDASRKLWLPFHYDQGDGNGFPAEPSALIADRLAVNLIGLETQKMEWRLGRNTGDRLLRQWVQNSSRLDNYKTHRIDYHDGLMGVVLKEGTTAQCSPGTTQTYILLIDHVDGDVRRIIPGSYSGEDYAGGILGLNSDDCDDGAFWLDGARSNALGPSWRGTDQKSSPVTQWGSFLTAANSLPWRHYTASATLAKPRDIAVFRDTDNYAYYFVASIGGLSVTKHLPMDPRNQTTNDTNAGHVTTYAVEVVAVEVDKPSGNLFWLTAAGAFYYSAKATWQAMGLTTPNAGFYVNGFDHDETQTFSGTLSRDSQERIKTKGDTAYIAADEGVYKSIAGAAFALLFGAAGSGAAYEVLPAGTTAVDTVDVSGDYLTAMCFNSTSGATTLVVIKLSTGVVANSQDVTAELGGANERASALGTGLY